MENRLWKELGLTREAIGLPPLSANEVDTRLRIIGIIEQERHRANVQSQKQMSAPAPGPRPIVPPMR